MRTAFDHQPLPRTVFYPSSFLAMPFDPSMRPCALGMREFPRLVTFPAARGWSIRQLLLHPGIGWSALDLREAPILLESAKPRGTG
jgi:hypothetical protein